MKTFKKIAVLFCLICIVFSLCSCRYINPTEMLFGGELPGLEGVCDDFLIKSYEPKSDVYEYYLLAVTSSAMMKNEITLPSSCTLTDGRTVSIERMEEGLIYDWVTLEKLVIENPKLELGEEINKSVSLKEIHVGSDVPLKNLCNRGTFVDSNTVTDLYFVSEEAWNSAKATYSGTERFNVFVKGNSSYYHQVQKGTAANTDITATEFDFEEYVDGVILPMLPEILDGVYMLISIILILVLLSSISKAKKVIKERNARSSGRNATYNDATAGASKNDVACVIFALAQIAFIAVLKIFRIDIFLFGFGFYLLLPMAIAHYRLGRHKRGLLTGKFYESNIIFPLIFMVLPALKYFFFSHNSLRFSIVVAIYILFILGLSLFDKIDEDNIFLSGILPVILLVLFAPILFVLDCALQWAIAVLGTIGVFGFIIGIVIAALGLVGTTKVAHVIIVED